MNTATDQRNDDEIERYHEARARGAVTQSSLGEYAQLAERQRLRGQREIHTLRSYFTLRLRCEEETNAIDRLEKLLDELNGKLGGA